MKMYFFKRGSRVRFALDLPPTLVVNLVQLALQAFNLS